MRRLFERVADFADSAIPNPAGCAAWGMLVILAVLMVWAIASCSGPSDCGGKGQPACPVIVPIIVPHVQPHEPSDPVEPPHIVPER